MIEDHQSHCIQYLKITMKTSLIDAIAVRKSRRFLDVFIYIQMVAIFMILIQTVGSFGLADGIMALLMAIFVLIFELPLLLLFLFYLLICGVISYVLTKISDEKFKVVHCSGWVIFSVAVLIWVFGMAMDIFPYNSDHRTYF